MLENACTFFYYLADTVIQWKWGVTVRIFHLSISKRKLWNCVGLMSHRTANPFNYRA